MDVLFHITAVPAGLLAFGSYLNSLLPLNWQTMVVEAITMQDARQINLKHIRHCTTFVCCVCAYGPVFTTLQLLSLAKFLEGLYSGCTSWILRVRSHDNTVIEAIVPFNLASTSKSNTSEVFHTFIWCKCACEWVLTMLLLIAALTGQAFKVFPWIIDTSQGANHMIMRWLRLYTHSKWLPHQNQTHIWCFSSFIWCGCGYKWVLTMLLLIVALT